MSARPSDGLQSPHTWNLKARSSLLYALCSMLFWYTGGAQPYAKGACPRERLT